MHSFPPEDALLYPEVECWANDLVLTDPNLESRCRIDVVEVVEGETRTLRNHDTTSLIRTKFGDASLRIFFVEQSSPDPQWSYADNAMISWFRNTFGTSPLFFALFYPSEVPLRNDGGGSFERRDSFGKIGGIDGFYQISPGPKKDMTYIWYSHSSTDTQKRIPTSTYIIYKCPSSAKDKIISLLGRAPECFLRPLSIDALILSGSLNVWKDILQAEQATLRPMLSGVRDSDSLAADDNRTLYNLHFISEHLHVIRGVLDDLKECIEHLIYLRRTYSNLTNPASPDAARYGEVENSLLHLRSQARVMQRWVSTYINHAQITVNLLFNLFTSTIAVSAKQDNSSMITMAAVTMFFLPGTFVSAVFSMVFFSADPPNSGLAVDSTLWLFFAITIPLTITVFIVWEVWRRLRLRGQKTRQARMPVADAHSRPHSVAAHASSVELQRIDETGALRESPEMRERLSGRGSGTHSTVSANYACRSV